MQRNGTPPRLGPGARSHRGSLLPAAKRGLGWTRKAGTKRISQRQAIRRNRAAAVMWKTTDTPAEEVEGQ